MSISPVDQKLIGVISEPLQNAPIILRAFNQVGHDKHVGFTLAAACAMVQKESGGRMIWGADPWNIVAFPKGAALDPTPTAPSNSPPNGSLTSTTHSPDTSPRHDGAAVAPPEGPGGD